MAEVGLTTRYIVVLLLERGGQRRGCSPTFIDRHPSSAVPRATRQQLYLEARQHTLDPHGVRHVVHWLEDGTIYCILVASTGEAVRQHHADRGLACDELHELAEFRWRAPADDEDQAMVRAAIRHILTG